ncbi:hypothetical protein IJG91_03385 [Candidatus Saccharibacteria bacterium]|nr:hypothetical protein [Candidatus Saccharibacteria bacterium]
MATKEKKVLLYHPHVNHMDGNFGDLLDAICLEIGSEKVVDVGEVKLVFRLSKEDSVWFIRLQELKADELPKIADFENGANEKNLDLPDGKGLSYRNVFAYDEAKNIIASVKISGCPQNGRLKRCIESITKEIGILEKVTVRFSIIFEKGLVEKIRNAEVISVAEFSSLDYDGSSISEDRFSKYKDYIGGKDYSKITTIKGKNGANIKGVLQPVIDDFISHEDGALPVAIKMDIDNEPVDFQRYYKVRRIQVAMDNQSSKHVDYDDLLTKLKKIVGEYKEDEE